MEEVGYIQLASEKSMQTDDIAVFHEWRNSLKMLTNITTTTSGAKQTPQASNEV